MAGAGGVGFLGKWKECRHENKEAVLRKMGVAEEAIPEWFAFMVTMELKKEGDVHIMTLSDDDGKVISSNRLTIGTPYTPEVPPGAPDCGEMISTYEEGGILRTKATDESRDYQDDMTLEPNGEIKCVQRCGGEESITYYAKV